MIVQGTRLQEGIDLSSNLPCLYLERCSVQQHLALPEVRILVAAFLDPERDFLGDVADALLVAEVWNSVESHRTHFDGYKTLRSIRQLRVLVGIFDPKSRVEQSSETIEPYIARRKHRNLL